MQPQHTKKKSVLFVCTGNICRSPLAHKIFERIVAQNNMQHQFEVDSCGIGAWHEGQNADSRMRQTAQKRGWALNKQARAFQQDDLEYFDYIIGMDTSHIDYMKSQSAKDKHSKMYLMREFDNETSDGKEVPDPYYGRAGGFEFVYNVIDRSCKNLFAHITGNKN